MTLLTHHLAFTARATTPLHLDAQAGSSVRGAIVGALLRHACANHQAPSCAACPLIRTCPVAALIAPLRDDPTTGGDQRLRPYVIHPPPGGRIAPGEAVTFGLRLFGSAALLLPYVVMAAHGMEQTGLGRPLRENNEQRGRVVIEQIDALHPLSGAPASTHCTCGTVPRATSRSLRASPSRLNRSASAASARPRAFRRSCTAFRASSSSSGVSACASASVSPSVRSISSRSGASSEVIPLPHPASQGLWTPASAPAGRSPLPLAPARA
jgi:hypothetical protein